MFPPNKRKRSAGTTAHTTQSHLIFSLRAREEEKRERGKKKRGEILIISQIDPKRNRVAG